MARARIPDPNHPPFTLPLDAPAFHSALAAGHGRAWLHALHHGVAEFKPAILHAMLHSLAWDPQTEDDRGDWLVSLIDAANAGDKLYPAFLRHVHDIPEGNRHQQISHLSQRGTILAQLHDRGMHGAADAVKHLNARTDIATPTRRADWTNEYGARQGELRKATDVIDWVRTTPWRQHVLDGWIWLGAWGRKTDDSALRAIIDALEETDDPIQQTRFLWIFRNRPMPHVSDRTLNLAIASDDPRRTAACRALRHKADPRVRAFALQHLNARSLARGILDLLAPNFEPGDCRRIEESLDVPEDESERHGLTAGLADYCEAVQRSECLNLLLFTYEHSPSTLARERVTDVMADLELCPAWLAEEGRFDAADSIRERFGAPKLDD